MEIDGQKIESIELTFETLGMLLKGEESPVGILESLKFLNKALKEGVPVFLKEKSTGKRYKVTNRGLSEVDSTE